MKLYTAIVHHDEGSSFGLTFPDLPGCFAATDYRNRIIAAGVEALGLWFEDHPEVEPSALDAVDAEGGILVLIPYIKPTQDVVRANVSLPRGVLSAIDAGAKERGLTRSAFIAHAALAEIEGRH
jgi:predicted RNase H-like HicB family nuclease